MKKFFLPLLLITLFAGCVQNKEITKTEPTVSYPKLCIVNKGTATIHSVVLPSYDISPVQIRENESMTFELNHGMYSYENVTVRITYSYYRSSNQALDYRVDFENGKTTVINVEY